ncbi:SMP-30/gluconolactonase/LRE family protein [Streptomyces sp. NPDC056656]|uniref:SMP-30/gluconolactonase/LRE family protein n=1 Tax=Streptomyces sp. NPDC056656 TaxID=3345895 RepID=UPI0036AE9B62
MDQGVAEVDHTLSHISTASNRTPFHQGAELILDRLSGGRRWIGLAAWSLVAAVILAAVPAAGASGTRPGSAQISAGSHGVQTIVAREFAKVAPVDPAGPAGDIGTVLEGPAFGPDGELYFVRSSALAGQPKILALDVRTRALRTVHTDTTGVYSSVQFSPVNGLLYATDFTGAVDRMRIDGSGFTHLVSGPVLGSTMVADDLTFDKKGRFFVTDMRGASWKTVGRVIGFDSDGHDPQLIQGGLASPNGISFDPEYHGLWVSEYADARELYLPLNADHTAAADGHPALYGNLGTTQFDSNAVDSAGNLYQCIWGGGKVLVYRPDGTLIARIVVPQAVERDELLTTNLAIKPGTNQGYLTVGGKRGGYIYTFRSPVPGGWQSNGGGPQ